MIVKDVRIKPTQIYDEWGKVMRGSQIVVVFQDSTLGPDRFACSRVNYTIENTKYQREFQKAEFLRRAKTWL